METTFEDFTADATDFQPLDTRTFTDNVYSQHQIIQGVDYPDWQSVSLPHQEPTTSNLEISQGIDYPGCQSVSLPHQDPTNSNLEIIQGVDYPDWQSVSLPHQNPTTSNLEISQGVDYPACQSVSLPHQDPTNSNLEISQGVHYPDWQSVSLPHQDPTTSNLELPLQKQQQAQSNPTSNHLQSTHHGLAGSHHIRSSPSWHLNTEETTDLEELETFIKTFKQRRLELDISQLDVGLAIRKLYGYDVPQTTISKFEAQSMSFKNMCKLKPLLQKWLLDAENSVNNPNSLNNPLTTPEAIGRRRSIRCVRIDLEKKFLLNPKPTSKDISLLADSLGIKKELVSKWFYNRRYSEKSRINPPPAAMGSPTANMIAASLHAASSMQSHSPCH